MSVIIPMGLFNLVGSLQNLESAEAAGDRYEVRSSLAANGIGTIAAACFGSCFPTTIYIGHPAWKSMGAGAGYSVANGLIISLLCFLGLAGFAIALIPVEAGAAILLWIGLTIAAQAFQATPKEHAPAIAVGFVPAIAAWGLLMLENGLRAAGSSIGAVGMEAIAAILPVSGLIALERGFIFTSMILAAFTVALVEKQFRTAAVWAVLAALLAATGVIHGFEIAGPVVVNSYGPSTTWPFVIAYLLVAAICYGFSLCRAHPG